jgi:hypothetical protein
MTALVGGNCIMLWGQGKKGINQVMYILCQCSIIYWGSKVLDKVSASILYWNKLTTRIELTATTVRINNMARKVEMLHTEPTLNFISITMKIYVHFHLLFSFRMKMVNS